MISAGDLGLLEFARDGADAWAILKQMGIGPAPSVAVDVSNFPLGGA